MLVAFTVTEFGEGSVDGAVYFPVASTVPRVAEPPVVPLTAQVTAVLVLPVTAEAKVREASARMFAVFGVTETETPGGGGGGGVCPVEDALPQEDRNAQTVSRDMPVRKPRIHKYFLAPNAMEQLARGTENERACARVIQGTVST